MVELDLSHLEAAAPSGLVTQTISSARLASFSVKKSSIASGSKLGERVQAHRVEPYSATWRSAFQCVDPGVSVAVPKLGER